MSAEEEAGILLKVEARLKASQDPKNPPFEGLRKEIAKALKNNKFDDHGVDCHQEKRLTNFAAGACDLKADEQNAVNEHFAQLSFVDQQKILTEAARHAR